MLAFAYFWGMRLLTLLSLFLCLPMLHHAQSEQLSVYKPNGKLGLRLFVGDDVQFKTQNGWQAGAIEALLTDSLVHEGRKIALVDILAVRQIRTARAAGGANLAIAGVIWPALVAINGLTSGARPLVTTGAIRSSALLLTAGGLMLYSSTRPYKTTTPGRLRIVHFKFPNANEPQPRSK